MSDPCQVLVVDDDELVTSMLTALLEARGHRFKCVPDVAAATRALATEHFDAVLLDMYLPDGKGLTVLDRALEIAPPPVVLMMTARADIRSAVETSGAARPTSSRSRSTSRTSRRASTAPGRTRSCAASSRCTRRRTARQGRQW